MNSILIAIISLGAIGLVAAVILYVASKRFAVNEDPRIAPGGGGASAGKLRRMWLSGLFGLCGGVRQGGLAEWETMSGGRTAYDGQGGRHSGTGAGGLPSRKWRW